MTPSTPTTFGEAIRDLAEQAPDRPAVTCAGLTITRAELDRRSNRLARAFAGEGVRPGDHVSIALDNGPDFMVAAFAAWKLGAVPQPLSARMPPAELDAVLDIVKPAGVVAAGRATRFPALPLDADGEDDGPLPPAVSPSWKATTSGGSTGRPKVIVTDAPALVDTVTPLALLAGMPRDGTAVVPGPLHHNAPFLFSVLALLLGTHVVLQHRFEAERVLRDLDAHQAGWLYVVPTMMQRIWRLGPETRDRYDLSHLRRVVHMAAPCPPWLKREWIGWLGPERILEIYSATEGIAATAIDGAEWLTRPGSVGRPVLGEITILDVHGRELPPGEVGHVWLRRGPDARPGYHYVGARPRTRDGGWECYGDLGYLDSDGYLFLTDRESDMILVGGANVYPAEIEAALGEHPAVLDSCVIGMPHEDLGAVPCAIVQTTGAVTADELAAFLRGRLSAYKIPRTFEFTAAPLRDDAGKVRRSALRGERLRRGVAGAPSPG
ncbi:bile acid-coenzyme A ligase [Thermocatellispora tengchongensis]|uniref:Bile acid-coenzyme A ligase n=1 Tax=Thermocatellispora tengchongensis TaxID=1073253 RepID=A0A840PEA6_9ACTN|nr:AMP-binding protein [Thermocatellispora tengchongensis]MBB5136273.1 bile acid-coenzyme A ligase [Thermocatellispora tengchongensis]